MASAGLTAKQEAFVAEYLVDLNATQAAIRAGYSEKTAGKIGYENLQKPEIASAIESAFSARQERTKITADRVLLELARVGLSDIRQLMTWDGESAQFIPSAELGDDEAATIASVKSKRRRITRDDESVEETLELELKTWDKIQALREMGKHLGIAEKLDVTATGGVLLVPASPGTEAWEDMAKASQERLTEAASAASAPGGS